MAIALNLKNFTEAFFSNVYLLIQKILEHFAWNSAFYRCFLMCSKNIYILYMTTAESSQKAIKIN